MQTPPVLPLYPLPHPSSVTSRIRIDETQPILSFQSRKPLPDRALTKSQSTSLRPSASETSIPLSPSEEVHEIVLESTDDGEKKGKKVKGKRQLDVKSREWEGLRRMVRDEMGGTKPSTSISLVWGLD